jgi:M6 family metalloprotease-like protein
MRASDGGRIRVFCLSVLLLVGLIAGWSPRIATAAESANGRGRAVAREGELVILHEDFKDHGRYLYFLKTRDGSQIPLHFRAHPPTNLLTGARIRVRGERSGGTLMLASGAGGNVTALTTTSTTLSSAPLPNTFGAQNTAVILVNFEDAPANQPWTPAQVQTVVFGSSGASGFLLEASYGQTWLTGNVYGWYTIPVSSTTCDTNQIATDANNAATASGVNLSAYTRFVYVFPYNSICAWADTATIGGNPSQSWVNGGGTTTNKLDLGTFDHAIGHNFGLYHSHGLDCGAVTLSGQCTVWEYFDVMDTMGACQGHYNSFQKERLGWLNYGSSPPITAVTASGIYNLVPYELADSNAKALKALKFNNPTNGLSYFYYIEYRQPLGFDSFISSMADQNETNGVVVHLAEQGVPNSSDVLDMTPKSSTYFDWNDVALVVGASYSDPDAGVTITTESANSSGATVSISLTKPSCVRALPAISISAAQAGPVLAGTTVNYTVSVSNNDSSSCGNSTFNLQSAIPYGWTANLSNSQLTLSPGARSATSLSVTSGSNSVNGPDSIGLTATNIADFVYSASAWATYMVGTPIAVTIGTSQTAYSAGQTVVTNAAVSSQGTPVANATVSFAVTESNGTIVSGSGTTGSNGAASFSFKLGHHPAKGTYAAEGQTTVNGVSASGTANFIVQ